MLSRTLLALFLVMITLSTGVVWPSEVDARSKSKQATRHKRSTKGKKKRVRRHRRRYRKKSRRSRRRQRRPHQFGAYVQTSDGTVIVDKLSDVKFNPASAIKLLTAYGALKALGPEHRFKTELLLDGDFNEDTGVFDGNVYVVGKDPHFAREDARILVFSLLDAGIKSVNGSLVVSKSFSLNCSRSALHSARGLKKIFKWAGAGASLPVIGSVKVGDPPPTAVLVKQHDSEELHETLKVVLSRSLNSATESIGTAIGGVKRLQEIATADLGIPENSIRLTSASGLGQNRITPRDMMRVLMALREELQKNDMDFPSVLPVAGIDDGTLEKRFTGETERGSVVAKTGTLSRTDGGVSALVGVVRSQKEDLYFVLFDWHGGVLHFRNKQDSMLRQLQQERGGPKPFDYRT